MEREEYLKRPLIEDVTYTINSNEIKIDSPHTLFVHVRMPQIVSLPETERLFGVLKKAAKETEKLKLNGVSKFLPAIRSIYPLYSAATSQMKELFSEIGTYAEKLRTDGLRVGCTDDELLGITVDKCNELNRNYYRNSAYSKFMDHHIAVKQAVERKPWENNEVISCIIHIA